MKSKSNAPDAVEILKIAIGRKKSISFEYEFENRVAGVRIGDPHAMYFARNNDINIHVWKTGGVATDVSEAVPDWRAYKVRHILNVQILEDLPEFAVADGYASESNLYFRAIAKI